MYQFVRVLSLLSIIAFTQSTSAVETKNSLFQFNEPDDAAKWQIVNDGVMGGRSSSRVEIAKTGDDVGLMRFTGTLSLENNGGFASVRSRAAGPLGLNAGKTIVLRVKGDGRRYTFNLYTPDRRTAFSYQLEFDTKANEWIEVKLPIDQFVARSFGQPMPSMKLDPTQVQSVGILLGDKKSGPFEILVDWIVVE
jgi:NADH dehydrogenase [ubiquinone] 1 alpha subcomplex assembly factor 1